MFTGLVQALGTVARLEPDGHGGATLVVREPLIAPKLELGESVSVNGVCLTAVGFDAETFAFQCGPETLARTALGRLKPGHRVNLERALRVGDALGGHFVTGHIDALGSIADLTSSRSAAPREPQEGSGEWLTVGFAVPPEADELLVEKGSIAVDGISLTLVDVTPGRVTVMLIPHTFAHTTLGHKGVGDAVNLEYDLLAKHVRKLTATRGRRVE